MPFTPGDLLVYQVGDGGTTYGLDGTGGSAGGVAANVLLDEYTPSGTFVQSLYLPTINNGLGVAVPVTVAIDAHDEGKISLSADGRLVTFVGYNAPVGTPSVDTTTSAADPRVIGTINGSGQVNNISTLSAYSAATLRSAATINGTQFWTGARPAASSTSPPPMSLAPPAFK